MRCALVERVVNGVKTTLTTLALATTQRALMGTSLLAAGVCCSPAECCWFMLFKLLLFRFMFLSPFGRTIASRTFKLLFIVPFCLLSATTRTHPVLCSGLVPRCLPIPERLGTFCTMLISSSILLMICDKQMIEDGIKKDYKVYFDKPY